MYSIANTEMRTAVRRYAAVEGMDARYTDASVDALFYPHYKAFRRLVAAEGHPHFVSRYTYTPASTTQALTDSTIQHLLSLRAIGVEESGGGTNPTIYPLLPVEDGDVFNFAGSTGIPARFQVETDATTGYASIYVYPQPDQIYTYHLRYYAGSTSSTAPSSYVFTGGFERLPILQTAQDIARRERDAPLVQMLQAEIVAVMGDIKRDARRLSRKRGERVDIRAAGSPRRWGRYGR